MDISTQAIHDGILEDICQKTGLRYRNIAGIDTSQVSLAVSVLPILAEWVPIVDNENIRAAIFTRFNTKNAASHLASMVEWAKKENYPVATDILNYALGNAVGASKAEWLWSVVAELPKSPNYYYLIARLASFPQTTTRAKDWLVEALNAQSLGFAELKPISEVDDPRILVWFSARLNDPDNRVVALARRIRDRSMRLPNGLAYALSEPNHFDRLCSAEIDAAQLEAALKEFARRFALQIPRSILKGRYLARLALGRWVVTDVPTESQEPKQLWIRLEDIDTVEIVLTPLGGTTDKLVH